MSVLVYVVHNKCKRSGQRTSDGKTRTTSAETNEFALCFQRQFRQHLHQQPRNPTAAFVPMLKFEYMQKLFGIPVHNLVATKELLQLILAKETQCIDLHCCGANYINRDVCNENGGSLVD